jgi:predicted membrane channel-forming protein YqfA (hemolysin III family)
MGSLITFFRNLLGHLTIFIIIFGWILIVSGIIFLVKPEKARKKLLRRGFKIIRGLLVLIAIYLIIAALGLTGKTSGILNILSFAGVVVVIIGFFKLKKNTYLRLQEQFNRIPVNLLRVYAIIQVIIGVLMVVLKRRV